VCVTAEVTDTGKPCGYTSWADTGCTGGLCLGIAKSTFACTGRCETQADCLPGWTCGELAGFGSTVCRCSVEPEVCDGLDNDCNGIIDDGDSDLSCELGQGPHHVCKAGACECTSPCNGACPNLQRDAENCGSCGNACPSGQVCEAGKCTPCSATCGPLEQCHNDICVAKLVELPGGFLMDATEVTRDQYAAWLATNPVLSGQPAQCNDVPYVPPLEWPPGALGDHPVVGTGWCGAATYCQSVGKRLCGKIGGGATPYDDFATLTSEWTMACTSGGANSFTFGGSDSTGKKCNGTLNGVGTTVPVGSQTECQSPDPLFAGIYDLGGNVWEWEDSCETSGSYDYCHVRGGSYEDEAPCSKERHYERDAYWPMVGFRCCADP